ncbi:RING-type E3 ubiquitin transferase [Heracleum sosnowskyi]|uniref:U-box domain-containing protein n=1 Tax=Heracleum sosnowskyi TaxID=360622 RepID=A0AAD8N8F1_9APIA|nr:RING-type E3 ubiquitin transferase [Heracleum sosnowskyi]
MRVHQMGGDGQVLDLVNAVKDGILGGGGVVGVGIIGEKMDLGKMIEELDTIEVPNVFICPISLEPMQDPVTLCTGQTYDRSNIWKWFSLGHLTCPTTMQELWDDVITPNVTLHQLIYSWFSQKHVAMKKRSEDVQGRVLEILERLKRVKGKARVQALKELKQVVIAHESAKKIVVDNGGVSFLSALLGNFTTHAVGCDVIGILINLELDLEAISNLMQPTKISLIVDIMNEGSIDTKIGCTKLIEMLLEGKDCGADIVSSLSLLVGLLRIVKDKRHPNGVMAGLRLLKRICLYEALRSSVVSIGAVPQLIEMLPNLNAENLELALYILEVLSTIPKGSLALKECPSTIPTIVKLLMKISKNCTQLALSILWAIFELAPEECAALAVDAGLAAKLLLVIQSGCNPLLKQRSAKLLKLCSLNCTDKMFNSNCKLTVAIR